MKAFLTPYASCLKKLIISSYLYLHFQKEAWNWTNRGYHLYRNQDYLLAEQCATIALHFLPFAPDVRAQPFLCRALSRYELGNILGTQGDINEIKKRDIELARVKKIHFANKMSHFSFVSDIIILKAFSVPRMA